MPFTTIYIHLVWCTKHREPFLGTSLKKDLFHYLKSYSKNNGIHLDTINGHLDHVHCLILMKRTQSISKVAKDLKGSSSNWLAKNYKGYQGTIWQPEYYAVSVGPERLKQVREYIQNQEEHHSKVSLNTELTDLNGFE